MSKNHQWCIVEWSLFFEILIVFRYWINCIQIFSGGPNYHLLQEVEAKLVGVGKTAQRYPLVIATDYNIPALLDAPGIGLITNFKQ